MVLLRSAFWLGVGYLVVTSGHPDLQRAGQDLTAGALQAGGSLIAEQALAGQCESGPCTEILAAILTSKKSTGPLGSELQQDLTPDLVAPTPPPRPEWLG